MTHFQHSFISIIIIIWKFINSQNTALLFLNFKVKISLPQILIDKKDDLCVFDRYIRMYFVTKSEKHTLIVVHGLWSNKLFIPVHIRYRSKVTSHSRAIFL